MARVIALVPDLLFGSRVQAMLTAAGHDVEIVGSGAAAEAKLGEAEVLVVDLTDDAIGGIELVARLSGEQAGASPPAAPPQIPRTLGFYSHVDVDVRRRAEQAGFRLVVPRSRMAREGGELVSRLAGG